MSIRPSSRPDGRWRTWRHVTAVLVVTVAVSAALAGGHIAPTVVNVVENQPDRIVLEYQFPEFITTPVSIDGQSYVVISLDPEPQFLIAGAPDLPHVARSLVIPDDGVMAVRVMDGTYRELTGLAVAPSKGNLLRTVDPATVPYEFGPQYATDAFFPAETAVLSEPFILRDVRGVTVDVRPIQYNAAGGTLRVYSTMTVEVTRVADGGANVLVRPAVPRTLSRAFYDIYTSRFLNFAQSGMDYPPVGETGSMLIICYDAWIPNMQPFVAHKNSIGIPTTIVGVSTIGNNATSIKNYIQNAYNAGGLAFVLLVGDAAQVATPTASGGSSDPTYTKLAGGDNWPDIIIGRFSAETPAQVDLLVKKSVEYEQNQATLTDWFWRGMGIASNQGAGIGDEGQADNVHIEEIRTWLLAHGYTTVDAIYDPTGTKAMVTNGLNAGRGIINYCGHGSQTSWSSTGFSNTDIAALVNYNMLPFIVSVACVNGQFSGATCFAEAWIRAEKNGQPTGAVAIYASSINQSWAPPMEAQDEFNIRYCAETYHSYGALCFNGSCSMIEDYAQDGVEMFDTWHIFGDPSLRVVGTTAPPTGLRVTPAGDLNAQGQAGGPFTPNQIDYTLENLDDTPLNWLVTKNANWVLLSQTTGTLPAHGTTVVTVRIGPAANFLGNGMYTDLVRFINLTNHDGDTERDVTLEIGVPSKQYEWTLDTNPGWTISGGAWAYGKPTGAGGAYGNKDPLTGKTGTNVYGYNLNGDYTNNMPEYHLTTTAIDCTNLSKVSLKFWRWLNVERSQYDHAYVRVSTNGTTWTNVWSNPDSDTTDNAWTQQTYDISAVADNQPTVYVRWTMGTTDSGWTYSGWNIDDVEIWGLAPSNPQFPLGDLNCDTSVDFGDINPFVLALTNPAGYATQFPNCNINLADINQDGRVDFGDINPFVSLLTNP